jgi:DNA-binding SARP family transcriptional activator/tetratricopeptide (TPR) repeat protein
LAFLLLHRGAHVSRDAIAFALWPDEDESDARANVRRHLHLLHQALPPADVPYTIAADDTLRWNDAAALWFDVESFERDVKDERTVAAAVEAYGGDLLPGTFDDWIFPIRDRLRRRYLEALDTLVVKARSARDFPSAARYVARVLEDDPWREDAVRQAAAVRFESGDRAGAIRILDAFAERLRAEMRVEPMPETAALRAALVRGAPLVVAARYAERQDGTREAFPFVGRDHEVRQLHAAWQRAASRRGQLLLVSGEAGAGKTRLANELALRVEAQGGRVLRGATAAPESVPYQPLVEALRDALPFFDTLDVRPLWLAAVAALLPEIALVRPDLVELPALEASRERARLFESLAAVFNALARQRPLLLLLEDVHWAGAGTVDAIEHLARRVPAMRALVLATYRPQAAASHGTVQALRLRLQRENLSGHIHLGGLGIDDVRALVSALPALAAEAEPLARSIHAASDGIPLFTEQLLRDRVESGGDVAPLTDLRATLEARIGRLSEDARATADLASVIGTTFDVELLRETTGWDENAVLGALGELVDRNLVRDIGRARFAFAFSHHLIAGALYGSIDEARLRRWHGRIARILQRNLDGRENAATLAYHFDRAGEAEAAAVAYRAAAQHAFDIYANDEALVAVLRGSDLAVGPRLRLQLLALHEEIAARAGDRAAQARALDGAERLSEELADAGARADTLRRRAALAHACGELADEAVLLERLEAYADHAGNARLRAMAARARARNAIAAGRYAEAERAAAHALARYRELGDSEGEVESLCTLAETAVNLGTEAAQEYLAEAQRRAAESGRAPLLARVLMASGTAAIMRRDFAAALRDSEAALERYREIGDREGEAETRSRAGTARGMLQQPDEARLEFARSAEIYRAIGNRLKAAYVLFNQTAVEIQLGLLDDASARLTEALAIFVEHEDVRGVAGCRTNQSVIALERGEAEEAKRLAEAALVGARSIGNVAIETAILANLGNAERELGQFEPALAHMREAIALRHRFGGSATFEELGDLALTDLAAGNVAAARETANEIMARATSSSENTVWPHYCLWAAARVYRADGDAAAARDALNRAQTFVARQRIAMTDPKSREAFAALRAVAAITAAAAGTWPPDAAVPAT